MKNPKKMIGSFCRTQIAKSLLVGSIMLLTSVVAQASTLIYCSEGSPEGFNPILYTSGTTFDVSSRPIFERLVLFKRGTTKTIPGLATSWDISADGKEYTFHLRKGVKFHTTRYFKPTRTLNADDVLFSFNRQLDKNNPWHNISGGTYEYFLGMGMDKLIKKVVKIDDNTVKFVLAYPNAPFIGNMAMAMSSIFSKEYADKMMAAGTPEKFDRLPIGTGPFQYVSYQKDAIVRFKANPNYWRAKAAIDNLIFAITPDASVRFQKLKANECQVMAYPNPSDVKAMESNSKIKILRKPGLNIGYLAYNTTKKPFDDVRVRKALNMAIDKKAIIAAVYDGAGQVAKSPIPPTIWGYNDELKDDPYNPEEAKKLLAQAGVKNLKTNIWAMPVQRPYNPNARRMAEIIQADWKKIGVDAEIISYEWGEYLKRAKNGEHQTILFGWTGDNGDPDNFLYTLLSCTAAKDGSNYARWCYKDYDALVTKAQQVTDKTQRAKLYKQAQVVFKQQAPWATIAHSIDVQPLRTSVKGYKIDPFGGHVFYGVSIEK